MSLCIKTQMFIKKLDQSQEAIGFQEYCRTGCSINQKVSRNVLNWQITRNLFLRFMCCYEKFTFFGNMQNQNG